jgi:hypothetical protein
VVLVGRLVDIAANLTQLSIEVSGNDRQRIRGLAAKNLPEEIVAKFGEEYRRNSGSRLHFTCGVGRPLGGLGDVPLAGSPQDSRFLDVLDGSRAILSERLFDELSVNPKPGIPIALGSSSR